MPLVTCAVCKGRNPSSAKACVHCGKPAALCLRCEGSGICKTCEGVQPLGFRKCEQCGGNGVCPQCRGNKVFWPDSF